ncbi:MAG: DUF3800 domain-containing protein [Methanobacteriaceae archaeon]|nr:DUF3800 domain-containing protein [Methanobacteriaceae archaeon]MDP3484782.1 DUF3800 domain-containing protein [Methanobacteriaceae archaeon]
MNYIFIDESGDPGIRGSKYMVIASLLIDNPKKLNRIIKNMRRNKFKKELSKANEIKGNKSSIEVKIHLLKELNKVKNCQIFCSILNKSNIHNPVLINDKNKLYNCIAGDLAHQIEIKGHVEVRIDKSKGKQILRDDFNNYFKKKLVQNSENIGNINIYHSYSHSWDGIQFADIIAWSYFQMFEHGNDLYTNLIEIECNISKIWDK